MSQPIRKMVVFVGTGWRIKRFDVDFGWGLNVPLKAVILSGRMVKWKIGEAKEEELEN